MDKRDQVHSDIAKSPYQRNLGPQFRHFCGKAKVYRCISGAKLPPPPNAGK
jgi:hypothetical protein